MNDSESSVLCRSAVSANIKKTTPPMSVTIYKDGSWKGERERERENVFF